MKAPLFLAEGFEDLEAVSILDVMGWTEYREWVLMIEVVTTGLHPEIKSQFGLKVKPDIQIMTHLLSLEGFTAMDLMKHMMTD